MPVDLTHYPQIKSPSITSDVPVLVMNRVYFRVVEKGVVLPLATEKTGRATPPELTL